MQFIIKQRYLYVIAFLMMARPSFAEQCPTPHNIKDRKINRDYEWTIDERRTLDDVLSVEKLYSIRIRNNGEYVACYYSGGKNLLRLDGKPLEQPCTLRVVSGQWNIAENGERVCAEDDRGLCVYDVKCDAVNDLKE